MALYVDSLRDDSCYYPAPFETFEMWIWCLPSDDGMKAAEFMIGYPSNIYPEPGTQNPEITVIIGDLSTGVSLTFNECQTDWVWTHHQTLFCFNTQPSLVNILPHPATGKIQFGTCAPGYPLEDCMSLNALEINQCFCPDLYPPALISARAVSHTEVEAVFSERVTEASAESLVNYYVCERRNPPVTIPIESITLHADQKTITIVLASPITDGVEYCVGGIGVEDLHGNILDWRSIVYFGYTPDLVISSLSVVPDSIYQETPSVEALLRVKNIGVWPAGPFRLAVRWYRGTPDTLNLATVDYGGLAPGDSLDDSIDVPVPTITGETNDLIVEVDDNNHVDEQREDNNREKRAIFVHLPDLAIYSNMISMDQKYISDGCSPLKLRYEIENVGTIAAGAFPVQVWISFGSYFHKDYLLAATSYPGLAAGGLLTDSCMITPPPDVQDNNGIIVSLNKPPGFVERHTGNNEAPFNNVPNYAPKILSISDNPLDGGGFVILVFYRCRSDIATVENPLLRYDIILENTGTVVGQVPASHQNQYSAVVSTIGDSTAAGIPWSIYRVRVVRPIVGTTDTVYYHSCPDSGYSANNQIATLLKGFDVRRGDSSIEIHWVLSASSSGLDFSILRERGDDRAWAELDPGGLRVGAGGFTFSDTDIEPGERYRYRVEYVESGTEHLLFETEYVQIPPLPLTLFQNEPNPFNPATVIRYYLPDTRSVRLEVFDVQGRRVAILADGLREKGFHQVSWKGLDSSGDAAGSGIYFYRLTAGKKTLTRKAVLLR